jgi:hypothetical protein
MLPPALTVEESISAVSAVSTVLLAVVPTAATAIKPMDTATVGPTVAPALDVSPMEIERVLVSVTCEPEM